MSLGISLDQGIVQMSGAVSRRVGCVKASVKEQRLAMRKGFWY
jgi:hypothetical protein